MRDMVELDNSLSSGGGGNLLNILQWVAKKKIMSCYIHMYNTDDFPQNILQNTHGKQPIAHSSPFGEIWVIYCAFNVWPTFYGGQWGVLCNIVSFWPCYVETRL